MDAVLVMRRPDRRRRHLARRCVDGPPMTALHLALIAQGLALAIVWKDRR
jgi:hypothetical protein